MEKENKRERGTHTAAASCVKKANVSEGGERGEWARGCLAGEQCEYEKERKEEKDEKKE